jgi:hypothetical protein
MSRCSGLLADYRAAGHQSHNAGNQQLGLVSEHERQ